MAAVFISDSNRSTPDSKVRAGFPSITKLFCAVLSLEDPKILSILINLCCAFQSYVNPNSFPCLGGKLTAALTCLSR